MAGNRCAAPRCARDSVCAIGGRWEARTALLALSVTVVQEHRRTKKNINF